MSDLQVTVADNAAERRFEAVAGGEVAGFVAYHREGDILRLTHTEVDDAYEGRGVGSQLAKAALDTIRARGERIAPECPFIQRYLERHEEYRDLAT